MINDIVRVLSAFPLTPFHDDQVDQGAFARLIERLVSSGVDSITELGSTGSYAYLDADERVRVAQLAVHHSGPTPVVIGVGDLRTSHVLAHVESAGQAGAAGLLLAPVTCQALTADGIAQLPGIASIKIPGVPTDPSEAAEHVAAIRAAIPEHVTIGVSGDAFGATCLSAGCDAWYSVIAGTLPGPAIAITRAARAGRATAATEESEWLTPLWTLFAEFGSLRVTAAIAEHLGLVRSRSLPLPIQALANDERDRAARVVLHLGLA
ncbi:4-hydroxy-tetrahydrodipicolinate synthase [Paraoerskovia marina]|uniref:4-hydroxy-tetrahydrodipicolinate synthase n=1 Tax=Paraoerskovia marina TaxID=545619 RepID=A0A1H1T0X5_9CELL|nr:dihydrodipicolinate synthase family protein [Paraoerskovia marina]SDS53636.1 4-hydroxy-tetrahydrodipicolinate synthase [Paraoerskovia marina]